MERKIFTIKSIQHSGGSVKIFVLSPDDRKPIHFKPGQFAMLFQLENGQFGKLSRPYSIASSPLSTNLRFTIKITGGQFTSFLDKLKIGDKLGVAAPFGHFTYCDEDNIVCFAAGTGVAPMLGILEYIAQKKKEGKFTLFYSSKKEEWMICRDLLDKLQKENPAIKVIYTLTQEQPVGWKGELGRISEEMVKKYVDYISHAEIFICGSVEFAKAMKAIMLKLGAEEQKIKIEAWS